MEREGRGGWRGPPNGVPRPARAEDSPAVIWMALAAPAFHSADISVPSPRGQSKTSASLFTHQTEKDHFLDTVADNMRVMFGLGEPEGKGEGACSQAETLRKIPVRVSMSGSLCSDITRIVSAQTAPKKNTARVQRGFYGYLTGRALKTDVRVPNSPRKEREGVTHTADTGEAGAQQSKIKINMTW